MKAATWIQDVAYSGNGEENGEGLGVGIRNRTTRNRDCGWGGGALWHDAGLQGSPGCWWQSHCHSTPFSPSFLLAKRKPKEVSLVELPSATNRLVQRVQTR